MTGAVLHPNSEEEFRNELNAAGEKLIVIDFFAEWCGPCKFIAPQLAEMAKQHTNVVFIKVDVDDLEGIAQEYAVRAMPTFVFLKGGKKVTELVGADAGKLKLLVQQHQ